MSKRRITLCVAFAALLFSQCAGFASAYEGNTSEAGGDLKFYTDGTDIVLTSSNTVELNNDQDVNVILAVYDNSRLIKTGIKTVDAGTTEYSVDNLRIHLSDAPENPTVKLLVWSVDDKIVPQAEARVPDRMDSVSFKAKEVAEDSSIGKNYTEYKKIPVYKSAQSALTYKYVLSEDNSGNVNTAMYVNGYGAGIVTNTLIENYILGNSNGTVTLVDYDSDGKYDRMDVSCTVDAVVDSTEISDGRVIINLLAGGYGAKEDENGGVSYAPISWDADNTAVKLIKNGKQIAYTELNTCDVLTVSYDVVNSDGNLAGIEGAEIYVSDETVSGTVTSRDTSDYTIRIGGTDYNVNENVADICAIDLSGYYIVYLNMYGQAVYFEKDVTKNNYGVIVAMYESAGRDAPVVRLVTPDGDVVAYECWNHSEADKFYNYATGTSAGYIYNGSTAFTKSTLRERIITGQTVCTYKLSSGKIKFGEACIGVGGSDLEYKASSGMLDSYAVSNTTKLIDMEDYMRPSSGSSEVVPVSVSAFEDQAIYDAYLFGRNGRGVYCFAIVFNGLVALPEQSPEPEITGIGIIVAMYQAAGKDYPTVSLVTADGEKVAYECKDRSAADQFYNYATGTSAGYIYNGSTAFTKSTLRERIITGQTVCTYKLSSGKIKFGEACIGVGGSDLEYKASLGMLDSYAVSDAAKLIDMEEYMSPVNAGSKANPITLSELDDGLFYDVYLYDKNGEGRYNFAVVFDGLASLNTIGDAAVVKSIDGITYVNDQRCIKLTVLKDGEEKTVFIADEIYDFTVGSVIVYKEGRDGYVPYEKWYPYIINACSYYDLRSDMLYNDNFASMLHNAEVINSGKYTGAAEPTFRSSTAKDVLLYFGPVYEKKDNSIEIITKKRNGLSDLSTDTVNFTIGENVRSYVYDYSGRPGCEARSAALPSVSPEIYNDVNIGGSINWNEADAIEPIMAFAKIVDGELTELVGYYPPVDSSVDAQIEPGSSVVFKAQDLADDNAVIRNDYVGNERLPIYASQETWSTISYPISAESMIYINDIYAGTVTNNIIDQYILKNQNGTVTLVDTDNDAVFDRILIEHYVNAVVSDVFTTSSYVKIFFKGCDVNARAMRWDPYDESINIKFIKNGEEIPYTDIAEDDVLSIKYDIANNAADMSDLDCCYVLVSSERVSGIVESRDYEAGTVTVNGIKYGVNNNYVSLNELEPLTDYTLSLDAFGNINHVGEGMSNKNYGVIVAMYKSAGYDYPTVKLVTDDGEVVAYECKDSYEAAGFYECATGERGYGSYSFTMEDIRYRIINGQTVCTYKLSGEKIKFGEKMPEMGGSYLKYNASSSKIGPYSINDSTKIIDVSLYSSPEVCTVTPDMFYNEDIYCAYLFDRNSDSVFRFAVVFGGITSTVRSYTPMAVVQRIVGTTDINGITCTEVLVSYNGQSNISVMFEGYGDGLSEGSVIAYVVGRDGYVDSDKYHTVFSPSDSYGTLLADSLGSDIFGSGMLKEVNQIEYGTYAGGFEPSYASSSAKDAVFQYGIVYRKSGTSLELLTAKEDGISYTTNIKIFDISTANSYVYDYGEKSKYRVSLGAQSQSASIFNRAYVDYDKNLISWDMVMQNDIAPIMALVKEVDNDVIDVFYYVAP